MKSTLLKFKLGYFIKWCLRPLVWTCDWLLGSDLKHCEGCQRRAEYLNKLWERFINWLFKD